MGIGHGMIAPSREPVSSRKRIAVVQSNYIPWKGFFDLIAAASWWLVERPALRRKPFTSRTTAVAGVERRAW